MKILAIETSCDETAAAVVEDGARILSNVVVSQIDIFAEYGGVIPEVAARSHLEVILPVVHKALADAGLTKDEIDVIAVTHTPGLLGSLLIGTLTARMLAILWGKPLFAVHHLKSHIYANWLKGGTADDTVFVQHGCAAPHLKNRSRHSLSSQATVLHKNASLAAPISTDDHKSDSSDDTPEFPLVALVVSGGHTQLIYMQGHNQFEIIGTTRDDAVGECFDKVAKVLGLPYPGGPSIDKVASSSRFTVLDSSARGGSTSSDIKLEGNYKLPHPKVEGLDFSFSGLKTAVLRAVQAELMVPITTPSYELAGMLTEQQRADFAAAFQRTACEILLEKLELALERYPEARSVVVAGGVSASAVLREMVSEALSGASRTKSGKNGESGSGELRVFFPERRFAGDNAAMVGVAAYYEVINGVEATDPYTLNIAPRSVIS